MMINLLPSKDEVIRILRENGAYRHGHFINQDGKHTSHHFRVPWAFHYYDNARILAVALSRKFRMDKKISSNLPKITMISPSPGVIPIGFSIRDTLNAEQIFWAENYNGRRGFPQYVKDCDLNPCIIVDDIVRSGSSMRETFKIVNGLGATVIGCGAIVKFTDSPSEIDGVEIKGLCEFDCKSYETAEEWELAEGNDSPIEEITF
jgi:orotate phosphoribosyltransferase